jgi:hypothetical protein
MELLRALSNGLSKLSCFVVVVDLMRCFFLKHFFRLFLLFLLLSVPSLLFSLFSFGRELVFIFGCYVDIWRRGWKGSND